MIERVHEHIIEETRKKKDHFHYNNETDESTIIKDVATRHSSQVSDMVETIGAESSEKEAYNEQGIEVHIHHESH